MSQPKGKAKANNKDTPKANIGLRPYFAETDKKYVHYLFYSTYFNYVPSAVLLKLKSSHILTPWFTFYSILTALSFTLLKKFGFSNFTIAIAQVIHTISVAGIGFLFLFWYTDKYDIAQRVVQGVENDLKEPDAYYRGTEDSPRQGNFWVLTLNNEIVGCVGMDHTPTPVIDQTMKKRTSKRGAERPRAVDSAEVQNARWKTLALLKAHVDDFFGITLVDLLEVTYDTYRIIRGPIKKEDKDKQILFDVHKPNEASVRRLAIKTDCQGHGLSTVLLKRVAFWAHSHQFEYLYAECNELQTRFADILVNKHGYTLVEKKDVGLFGSKSVYRLDVKLWMSKELERRKEEQILEDFQKEEEEIKQYE